MQNNRKKFKKITNWGKILFRLILKQTIAALLCFCIAFGMHNTNSSPFRSYADALGRAMRYESDFGNLIQLGEEITDKLKTVFSSHEESSL